MNQLIRRSGSLHFWYALLILISFCVLTIGTARTSQPKPDEAVLCNPGYNLVFNGYPGTTLYETLGYMPESLKRWTYWHFPAYTYVCAVWFKVFGFGLLRMRLLSTMFGLLGLTSWYWIARCLSGSANAGLVSMALVAADFSHGFSAATGRMDMQCCSMGAAALGSYLYLREKSLPAAAFAGHAFATFCILTHPVGMLYYLNLVLVIVVLDRRRLSVRFVLASAVPVMVGGSLFFAYVRHDIYGFREQLTAALQINAASFRDPGLSANPLIRSLQLELRHRYIEPFGLSSGGGFKRLKIIILAAYLAAIFGNLFYRRSHQQPGRALMACMALIAMLYMGLVSPSKFSYYLAHVTAFLAAGLGLFLCSLGSTDRVQWRIVTPCVLLLAGLQIGGEVLQIRQDAYGRNFLPVIETIRKNTNPQSIIFGSGELWFGIEHDRYMLNDFNLGALSGVVPNVFIMDEVYRDLHETARSEDPRRYEYVERMLKTSREIYRNGGYQVYLH